MQKIDEATGHRQCIAIDGVDTMGSSLRLTVLTSTCPETEIVGDGNRGGCASVSGSHRKEAQNTMLLTRIEGWLKGRGHVISRL